MMVDFDAMLDGVLSDDAIRQQLVALAAQGESADDIVRAASAMRARMVATQRPAPDGAIDVCGTGGDGQHSLNISTAVALVLAAMDVPVAKHGNRAASSRAGAADTLEALGLDLARAATGAERTLHDIGIGFFFAQSHHPALARIAPIRRAIGSRTIFNLLGPLCNPARVTRQLIGVPTVATVAIYAEAALHLGYDRALIVCGHEGIDELSIAGESTAVMLRDGALSHMIVTPEDAGLPRHPLAALKGGDAAFNAAALNRLLDGQAGAYRDAVLLNAAAALLVAGEADDLKGGAADAAETIDKGLARGLLNCWLANQ